MTKYEVLQLRKMIADAEFVENMTIQLNTLNMRYAQEMINIEKLARTVEDYELLTSALWDAYEHEISVLKELCVKHNINKGTMMKLFGGVYND